MSKLKAARAQYKQGFAVGWIELNIDYMDKLHRRIVQLSRRRHRRIKRQSGTSTAPAVRPTEAK